MTETDHFDEQFPLSSIDDHLIHQTPDPIRVMWSSDPRTYERHWNVFHDDTGELMVVTGGSFYPSLNTAEAYAIVVHNGQHRAVRAFRPLGADRMNLHIGPIKPTIIQGLRQWHFLLEENEWASASTSTGGTPSGNCSMAPACHRVPATRLGGGKT